MTFGPSPDDLVIEDIIVGDGTEAVVGKHVVVHYVGVGATSGNEFDASWNRGDPFDFDLGASQVIQGWDRGVQGMRVGGRRRLVIPAHLDERTAILISVRGEHGPPSR